jgi:drug/metabolite transporter (DMT)-like permease
VFSIETTQYNHGIGALAALGSAFCWALAAILFRRVGSNVTATGLNLSKGLVAFICLGALLLTSGFITPNYHSFITLALSGIIGICLGDTLYFITLVRLGPRLTLLVGSLIPVIAGLISLLLLNESINTTATIGIALTLLGVAYVLWEKAPDNNKVIQWRSGVLLGMLFVCTEALGIVLTKIGVQNLPGMEATFIRQTVAIVGLTFWGLAAGSLLGWLKPLKKGRTRNKVIVASIIGAFLGTWLSVLALKYTYTSVAAALNATSPLFILPMAALLMREKISRRAVAGTSVAVIGIAEYFLTLPLA